MIHQCFTGYSIFHGAVRYSDLAYVIATCDEMVEQDIHHTRIYQLDVEEWGGKDLGWTATSCSICHTPNERLIVISPEGRVLAWGEGEVKEENEIISEGASPNRLGPLREVKGIANGRAFACGTNRQLYRRDAPDQWTYLSKEIQPADDQFGDFCFESIDGFSETDIYAVGWEGEIWHLDGQTFKNIPSPTNLALHAVKCTDNRTVYAAGQCGTILKGSGELWVPIEHDLTRDHFRSIEAFNGGIYFSTGRAVFELRDNELKSVDWGNDAPGTCLRLSASDGRLWSIGAKDIMENTGSGWNRVLKIE